MPDAVDLGQPFAYLSWRSRVLNFDQDTDNLSRLRFSHEQVPVPATALLLMFGLGVGAAARAFGRTGRT